uniref:Uncharacterized protein n=1 Tax=Picea glauca TaxID=3330 RepID=A0A101M3C0_PICGL|nr:hypothetical protein ABT39_MTgene3298 [Picea glauca]QHR89183.1 hypothetical protein Q903MT_gene3203 [Picea sitchensis]
MRNTGLQAVEGVRNDLRILQALSCGMWRNRLPAVDIMRSFFHVRDKEYTEHVEQWGARPQTKLCHAECG